MRTSLRKFDMCRDGVSVWGELGEMDSVASFGRITFIHTLLVFFNLFIYFRSASEIVNPGASTHKTCFLSSSPMNVLLYLKIQ